MPSTLDITPPPLEGTLPLDRRVCIAPMLGWTDRHCRFFFRQITARACVYSEMLAPEAILFGDRDHYLRYDPAEHPVAFQLGGNEPSVLAAAAHELERVGYDEVNFNVGCPSAKGQANPWGAYLISKPRLVADCVAAMIEATSLPVSVKTRIGVDRQDNYEPLAEFVGTVKESGCKIFIIHARKAWLDGLSPKENREIPPLRYDYVYRLKREFPELTIIINGGINDWGEARLHLEHVDGVMVGRRAYKDPFWLTAIDRELYGATEPSPTQSEILRRCIDYVERELAIGTPMRAITRHMTRLYSKAPAAKAFRYHLAEVTGRRGAGIDTFLEAIAIAERKAVIP
jgi:tRNA-dihydrouridine synthase A